MATRGTKAAASRKKAANIAKMVVLILGVAAFLFFALNPNPIIFSPDLSRDAMIALGILLLVISLWVTDVIHNAFSGLIGCVLLYAFGRLLSMPALTETAFFGFSEPSVWFVFCGLVIGCALYKSGLSKRIFFMLFNLSRGSYGGLVLVMMLFSYLLLFIFPSTDGRTILLITLLLGLRGLHWRNKKPVPGSRRRRIGWRKKKEVFVDEDVDGDNEDTDLSAEAIAHPLKGLFVMIPMSTGILGIVALSSVSAITAQGLIERYTGISISYLEWFIYFLPGGLACLAVLYFLTVKLFKCPIDFKTLQESVKKETENLGSVSPEEKRAIVVLSFAVLAWLTGSFLNIRADIVAMFAASILLLPKIGFLTKNDVVENVNWLIAPIFLGTILSIVEALSHTGMLDFLGKAVLGQMISLPGTYPEFITMILVCLVAGVTHLFTSHSTMLIASTMPLLLTWSLDNGLGLFVPLIFVWGSQIEFMVYQSSAILTAYSYGEFTSGELLKFTVPFGLFLAIGGPLIFYAWWNLLGIM